MPKIRPITFAPELVSTMRRVLDAAVDQLDNAATASATTPATKAKMAQRIVQSASEGITDAHELKSAAVEEGLVPAD